MTQQTSKDAVLGWAVSLPDPQDTDRLGAAAAAALKANMHTVNEAGFALRLCGNLGAGKTSFMRALLRALGWQGPVKSPTFSLLETYDVAGACINHFDFYRFEEPIEFEDAGFRDLYAPGAFSASEWSERAEPYLPKPDLVLSLAEEGLGRRATIVATTNPGEAFLNAMRAAWNAAA